MGISQDYKLVLIVTLLYTACGLDTVSHADVTSSGLNTTVTPAIGGVYEITGGTRPDNGANLFHSFGNFSLAMPESAVFLNNSGLSTKNILSRVTGGNPSSIFGTIDTSAFPGANLYLMNPAGIMFGPTAQLNVSGSFHATTADYIVLDDGRLFNAAPSATADALLSSAAPAAFGFLTSNPAGIDVNTSDYFLIGAPEETLSFVGGTVNVGAADGSAPGYVLAPGGRLNLVSVASPGEATFDGTGFNVDGFAQLGNINIRGESIVDGKEVFIRGGQLTIDDGIILPNVSFYFLGGPAPDGGEVNIKVSGDVTITGTSPDPLTETPPGIFVFSGDFYDLPAGPGKVPDVNIEAGGAVSISGFAGIQSDRMAPDPDGGAPGNILIKADTVSVTNGGSIGLFNQWEGIGGDLIITAKDVNLTGDGSPSAIGFEGLGSQSLFNYVYDPTDPTSPYAATALTDADSGNITLNLTGNLIASGLAQITTDSLTFGGAGNVTVTAGNVSLTGTGLAVSGAIGSQSALAGNAGSVTINASGTIEVQNGFRITSSTGGSGQAGDVSLNAGGSVTVSGPNARVLSRTNQPPDSTLEYLFSPFRASYSSLKDRATAELGIEDPSMFDVLRLLRDVDGVINLTDDQLLPGDAGNVFINAPTLTVSADGKVETSTGWGQLDPSSNQVVGNAGNINVAVESLFVTDGASISSSSGIELLNPDGTIIGPRVDSGNAGTIELTAADTISISGRSPTTGAGSRVSTSTFGDGNGGTISISGINVNIANGGLVSADSGGTLANQDLSGTGLAGDILVSADNKINLNNGTISTRAVTADGGNITLTAPEWVYLLDSDITTSVESGIGGGGNITIDPQFVVLNQSNILANAYGGPGGNITIVADNLISSAQSSIDASSALGINGTVNISSPDQDVAQELAVLPENFLDVTGLISDRCGATSGASSLVSAGPGGLAVDPDNYLPSFGAATKAGYNGTGKSSATDSSKPWWTLAVDSSALQLAQVTCTR